MQSKFGEINIGETLPQVGLTSIMECIRWLTYGGIQYNANIIQIYGYILVSLGVKG